MKEIIEHEKKFKHDTSSLSLYATLVWLEIPGVFFLFNDFFWIRKISLFEREKISKIFFKRHWYFPRIIEKKYFLGISRRLNKRRNLILSFIGTFSFDVVHFTSSNKNNIHMQKYSNFRFTDIFDNNPLALAYNTPSYHFKRLSEFSLIFVTIQ